MGPSRDGERLVAPSEPAGVPAPLSEAGVRQCSRGVLPVVRPGDAAQAAAAELFERLAGFGHDLLGEDPDLSLVVVVGPVHVAVHAVLSSEAEQLLGPLGR